jgi:hypothetical protein
MPVFVYLDVAGKNLLRADVKGWLPIDRLRTEDFLASFASTSSHGVALDVAAQLAKESCHVTPVNVNVVLALVDQGSLATDMAWLVRLATDDGLPDPHVTIRIERGRAAIELRTYRKTIGTEAVACSEGENLAEAISDMRARLDANTRETSSAPRAE